MLSPAETLAYHLLRLFSHSRHRQTNAEIAAEAGNAAYDPETPRWFLSFLHGRLDYAGKRLLDIGCGFGDLCLYTLAHGAAHAAGVDVDCVRIEGARRNASAMNLASRTDFQCGDFVTEFQPSAQFDIVFSLDAFEHVTDSLGCLRKAHQVLRPGGLLATLFGPLWYSPNGGHMGGFTPIPWVHLLFPERAVLKVREEKYRPDQPAERYEDIPGHLSRMTVARFRAAALAAGFRLRLLRLNPDKDVSRGGLFRPANALINTVPLLRELGAQLLLAILEKPVK